MCVCVGRLRIDMVCCSLSSEHKIGKRLSELLVDRSPMTVVLRALFHRRAYIKAGISPSRESCLSV